MLKWKFRNATLIPYLLGILKFENVSQFKVPLFTYKIINDLTKIPTIFHRTLTLASEIHTHNNRFASKLSFRRPKANNNYGTSTTTLGKTIPKNFKNVLTLPFTTNMNYTF